MGRPVLVASIAVAGMFLTIAHAGSQPAKAPAAPPVAYATTSSSARDGMPAWFIRGSYALTGPTSVAPGGKVTVLKHPSERGPARANPVPYCERSIICANPAGPARTSVLRVTYRENLGYAYQYPYNMPTSAGGAVAVALDKANNLWVLQRTPPGTPKLFKFDANARLVLTVPEAVTGDMLKAHGMKADADGNVWILDTSWATARKISPDGKLLQTIGVSGKRGDWDEAKGQRLLWEPVMVDFGADRPTRPLYILPTIWATPGFCISTGAAISKTSISATIMVRENSTRRMVLRWIPRRAICGSATGRTTGSSC